MPSTQQITDVIVNGINRFIKRYQQPAENIQIVFKLDQGEHLQFFTCINYELKNTVRLEDLKGKDIYNFAIKLHIKKRLQQQAKILQLASHEINFLTGVKMQNQVYVWLRKDKETLRQMEIEELS